jgi:hypothetical protein
MQGGGGVGEVCTVSPKARGLAQHGGPPGWLEESDPAGCDFYVMEGQCCLH